MKKYGMNVAFKAYIQGHTKALRYISDYGWERFKVYFNLFNAIFSYMQFKKPCMICKNL